MITLSSGCYNLFSPENMKHSKMGRTGFCPSEEEGIFGNKWNSAGISYAE
jgi:hypothetical protein